MKLGWHIVLSSVAALVGVQGCAASSKSGEALGSAPAEGPGGRDFGSGGAFSSGGSSGEFVNADAGAALPPEHETKISFELPQAGKNFVYVANPDSNTVSVLNAKTLGIQTVQAGAQPTFLQTLGGQDAAIVLNVKSSNATIVRTSAAGSSSVTNVDVQDGLNAIAVAPDGKHAVVYFDVTQALAGTVPGSVQDVSVITLDPAGDRSTGVKVGFQPSAVSFSSDGARGFVVTQAGVSILDFAAIEKNGPGIADTVAIGDTSQTFDVSITPDGKYALARQGTASVLRLVDLSTGGIQTLDLTTVLAGVPASDAGAPPVREGDAGPDAAKTPTPTPTSGPPPDVTDVDLALSGAYAMAVVRDRSSAVRIPIPGAFADPSLATVTTVPNELVGSVTLTPEGKYALLYTTAVDTNRRITILPLSPPGAPRSFDIRKSIQAIAVSPDDGTALVLHKRLAGDPNEFGIDAQTALDRKNAYSLLKLDTGFSALQIAAAPPGPFTIVPDGSELFILFNSNPLFEVERVDLASFAVQRIELGSPPVSIGPVPSSNRVFVGQDHPAGRISFIDWTTGAVQSVTGFELNSQVRE